MANIQQIGNYLDGIVQETGENVAGRIAGAARGLAKNNPYAFPIKAGLSLQDMYSGYNNANTYYPNPTMKQKLASAAGGFVHGELFGTIPERMVADYLLNKNPPLTKPTTQQLQQARLLNSALRQ